MTRERAEVIREAKYLLRLNERAKGGPYGGYAAERYILVMREIVDLLDAQHPGKPVCGKCGNKDAILAPHTGKILCDCCSTTLLIGLHECLTHSPAGSNRP